MDPTQEAMLNFTVEKAKRLVRERYNGVSEVKDYLSVGEATQVHHIFPEHTHPEIRSFIENLILLTPSQHFTVAHPSNDTRRINRDYQLICLLSKSDSVQKSVLDSDGFYSKDDFVYVLNSGLEPQKDFDSSYEFNEIKQKIAEEYERN
jgi:hypothetical protein